MNRTDEEIAGFLFRCLQTELDGLQHELDNPTPRPPEGPGLPPPPAINPSVGPFSCRSLAFDRNLISWCREQLKSALMNQGKVPAGPEESERQRLIAEAEELIERARDEEAQK